MTLEPPSANAPQPSLLDEIKARLLLALRQKQPQKRQRR
jgi:hypothetical protein